MGALIFLIVSLVLLGAFLALTQWEAARGRRLFAPARDSLDLEIERAAYVAGHVDWSSYFNELLRSASLWISHEVAHLTLRFVRFIERILAKTVRQLRQKAASADAAPGEPTRPFIEALSDFKEELKDSRPQDLGNPPE